MPPWPWASYTPETVESITRVPAKDVIKAARFYATSKPAVIHWGVDT